MGFGAKPQRVSRDLGLGLSPNGVWGPHTPLELRPKPRLGPRLGAPPQTPFSAIFCVENKPLSEKGCRDILTCRQPKWPLVIPSDQAGERRSGH